jgi:alanyl-tRNA synthetase
MRVDGCIIQIYWQNMDSFGLPVEVTQERISKKELLIDYNFIQLHHVNMYQNALMLH